MRTVLNKNFSAPTWYYRAIIAIIFMMGAILANGQKPSYKIGSDSMLVNVVTKSNDKDTGFKVEIKGVKYPVFVSARGKYYIVRISKKGNEYKQYLEIEGI